MLLCSSCEYPIRSIARKEPSWPWATSKLWIPPVGWGVLYAKSLLYVLPLRYERFEKGATDSGTCGHPGHTRKQARGTRRSSTCACLCNWRFVQVYSFSSPVVARRVMTTRNDNYLLLLRNPVTSCGNLL